MSAVMWLLTSKLGRMLASAGAVLALIATVFLSGRKYQADKIELKEIKQTIKTHERIADAPINSSRPAAVERLRKHGQFRD